MSEYEELCAESADELEVAHERIDVLTKRVAELEAALEELSDGACTDSWSGCDMECRRTARAALKGGG